MGLYKLMLRLYPASFRAEYGPELCRLYASRRRNASGLLARLALFLEDLADVLRNAPPAHLDILRQDLRYTARTLGRAPAFALTAVAVTALGIGANTAVFSVTDQVLIRPLPYADAPRLVKLWETGPETSRIALGARPGNILALVLREGIVLAAIGGLVGALGAYAAGRSLEALLSGVRPDDAATFLVAATVVLLMTVSGSLVPALRALRVDPVTALRAE